MLRGTKRKFTDENAQERLNKRKLQSIEQHAQRMAKARTRVDTKARRPLQDVSNADTTLVNPSTPSTPSVQQLIPKTPLPSKPAKPTRQLGHIDYAGEYDLEIMAYEMELELKTAPRNWLELQPAITAEHRSILLNWLYTVHGSFGLLPETFHICVNMMDRFLSKRPISLEKFQLTALASLWIACKTHETVSPSIKDLLFVCDNGYTPQELRKAESFVLKSLDWLVGVDGWSGLYNWLARLNKTDGNDWHVGTLARYLCEAFIVGNAASVVVSGRLLACAATWLARKVWALSLGIPWEHVEWTDLYSGCTDKVLEPLAKQVLDVVRLGTGFEQVRQVYARGDFCGVSLWMNEWISHYLAPSSSPSSSPSAASGGRG